MSTDRAEWTICYRKRTANRFVRVTNWVGTWSQALGMARIFAEANPELQVYYTSSAGAEAEGRVHAEDVANILTDGGKRIRIVEQGELPQSMIDRMPAPEVARERWSAGEPVANPEAGLVAEYAKGSEQVDLWLARHSLRAGYATGPEVLAARERDFDEALGEAARRDSYAQLVGWYERHGTPRTADLRVARMRNRAADHDEALARNGHP